MEMIQAKNLARAQGMPVAVENKWLKFDFVTPGGAIVHCAAIEDVASAASHFGRRSFLLVNLDGSQEKYQICTKCGLHSLATEFTHTFYCPQSEGPESEDFEECLECRNEANEAQGKAAGL